MPVPVFRYVRIGVPQADMDPNVKMYAYLLDFVTISFNTEVLQQNNCPKDSGLEEETKP